MVPRHLRALALDLIHYDCPMDYYLELYGFTFDHFKPENIEESICGIGASTEKCIEFVNCAIALGRSDDFIIELIERLDAFKFDATGFVILPIIKGISNRVAQVLCAKPMLEEQPAEQSVVSIHHAPIISQNLSNITAETIFFWIQKQAQYHQWRMLTLFFKSIHPFTSFRQISGILDLILAEEQPDEDFIVSCIDQSTRASKKSLIFSFLYVIFKCQIEANFPQAFPFLRTLPNMFERPLLNDYLNSVPDCDGRDLVLEWCSTDV